MLVVEKTKSYPTDMGELCLNVEGVMRVLMIAGLLFGSGMVVGVQLGKKLLWHILARDYIVLYKGCFSQSSIESAIKKHKERRNASKSNKR